ncbi:hypothetical protein H0H93_011576, partial [Arthromyces matolae]
SKRLSNRKILPFLQPVKIMFWRLILDRTLEQSQKERTLCCRTAKTSLFVSKSLIERTSTSFMYTAFFAAPLY